MWLAALNRPAAAVDPDITRRISEARAMQTHDNLRTGLMVAWSLAAGLVGYAAGVRSVSGVVVLLALACLPPLVLVRFWRLPPQSMSEAIQRAKSGR
jgi:hypothetical protein